MKTIEIKSAMETSKNDGTITVTMDGYPWYLTKIDSTHVEMVLDDNVGVGGMTVYHVGQLRGGAFRDDIRKWLKGGDCPDGKKYDDDGNLLEGNVVADKIKYNHGEDCFTEF